MIRATDQYSFSSFSVIRLSPKHYSITKDEREWFCISLEEKMPSENMYT